jgi:predicted aspartyl protease
MNLKRSIILFSLIFLHITLSFAQNKVVAKGFSNVYILPIEIQDKTFHFLFDTGASQSVINEEALQELKIRCKLPLKTNCLKV